MDELKHQLEDDQIQYAVIRLGGIEEDGSSKGTTRDVFINWIGPGVAIADVDKNSAHLGGVQVQIWCNRTLCDSNLLPFFQNYLQPFHAEVTVKTMDNFNRQNVLDKSHLLFGSQVID